MKFYWNPLRMPRWVRLITAIVLYIPAGFVFGTIVGLIVATGYALVLGAVPSDAAINGLATLVNTVWLIFTLWFILAKRRIPLQEKKESLFKAFKKDCVNADWKETDCEPVRLTDRR